MFINKRQSVSLNDLRVIHMDIFLMDGSIPVTEEEFDSLPMLTENSQPLMPGKLFRLKLSDCIHCYLARATSRRRLAVYKTNFAPFISHKTQAASDMVTALSVRVPQTSGYIGTLVGSELLTCALNSLDVETLKQWIEYKQGVQPCTNKQVR